MGNETHSIRHFAGIGSAAGDNMKSIRKKHLLKVCLGIVLTMLLYPVVCFSQEAQPIETTTIERKMLVIMDSSEPGQKAQTTRNMTLDTSAGPYYIIDETKVLDAAGKESTMDALPVPCEAEITYQPLKGHRKNALQIAVKSILPKASPKWSDPLPQ